MNYTRSAFRNTSLLSGIFLLVITALTLSACVHRHAMREETADRLSAPAWMNKRVIEAGQFELTAFERVHKRYDTADIYIEGDGDIESSWTKINTDPTPWNPVALHLATRDKADNVIYIARPCQFTQTDTAEGCDKVFWNSKRFSKEVLDSYHAALNDIKRRWNISGFHLNGFGGGGAIAALLAAERDDVLSLRTVAGNLDHVVFTNYHDIAPLESLNPVGYADKLARMPQTHYFGGADTYIPPAVAHSYLQALGDTNCVNYEFIQEATHLEGWVDKWPGFLAETPACRGPVAPVEMDFDYTPAPIRVTREVGKGQKP